MRALQNERAVQTACLLILTIFAVVTGLVWLRPVVVPFVLALFLAVGLSPVVDFQESRLRLPRALALGSTLLIGVLLIGLLGVLGTARALPQIPSLLDGAAERGGSNDDFVEDVVFVIFIIGNSSSKQLKHELSFGCMCALSREATF